MVFPHHFHVADSFYCPLSVLQPDVSEDFVPGETLIHLCLCCYYGLTVYAHKYSIQIRPLMLQSTIKYIFSVFLDTCLSTGWNCFVSVLESSSCQNSHYFPHSESQEVITDSERTSLTEFEVGFFSISSRLKA